MKCLISILFVALSIGCSQDPVGGNNAGSTTLPNITVVNQSGYDLLFVYWGGFSFNPDTNIACSTALYNSNNVGMKNGHSYTRSVIEGNYPLIFTFAFDSNSRVYQTTNTNVAVNGQNYTITLTSQTGISLFE